MRVVLYEKGIPIKLIDITIKGRTENKLYGEFDGILSNGIDNDKGPLQGSPVSALIYIIFADDIMDG